MGQTLQLVPYDSAWPEQFEAERTRISAVLGTNAVRIDHHGSTAVPGLAAKPIIDIQVSVKDLHPIERYTVLLRRLGYCHAPHADDAFCPFFHRPAGWPHTHHIHLVQSGGAEEQRTLGFRDYLRDHPDIARAYEQLKRQLAPQYQAGRASSRRAYAEAKTEFIVQVVQQALASGYPERPRSTAT